MNPPELSAALVEQLRALSIDQRKRLLRQIEREDDGTREHGPTFSARSRTEPGAPEGSTLSSAAMIQALTSALHLAPVGEEQGARIGPYRLLEQIGEGGFGVVWMAEQTEPIRRQVACKIIKVGMDTHEVIARFEAERQALALMDHPNIARVFAAGATDSGRPYFVMELVRGTAITRYCDEHRLSTDARLRLFILVCRAVQHAHQKGIIHRDLKPSNILVTLHDGVPVPKIIDFGIAKATQGRLTDKTLFTRFHAFLGTPAYASPEQMELSGLDLDTRADIYSLGALLYELLAGGPPFEPGVLAKSGLDEMRRTIREIDPPLPSTRISALEESVRTAVARERGANLLQLSRQLRGDLDSIVMRCLEKDRGRRYESASTLVEDIQRHLDHEPVLARPPSASDRWRKSVRRHRLGYAVGAVGMLAVFAGMVLLTVMLVRERAARARESALRSRAEASAEVARVAAGRSAEVARFMKDTLSGAGPSVALGRDTTILREILESTRRRLDTELHDQPAVSAELREILGAVYRDLGRYETAEALVRAAVETRRQLTVPGERRPALASGLTLHGEILRRLNQSDAAESALQEALAVARKDFGEHDLLTADALFQLAQLPSRQRSWDEVEKILREVLAVRREALGPDHRSVADVLSALAKVARARIDNDQAAALEIEALTIYRKVLGHDHPAVAESMDSLGHYFLHTDRHDRARELYREAFFLRRKILEPDHPRMVAGLLRYIGQIPAAEADEATIALVREFIARQRKTLHAGSPLLAPPLLALATLLDLPARDPGQARALRTEARQLLLEPAGGQASLEPEVLDAMGLYGWWKFFAGRSNEGIAMSEVSLEVRRRLPSVMASQLILPSQWVSWLLLDLGRPDEAVTQFQATAEVMRAAGMPPGDLFFALNLSGLGAALREAGRPEDSRRALEQALASWQRGIDSIATALPDTMAVVLLELGLTLNQQHAYVEAERVLRVALERYERGAIKGLSLRIHPRTSVDRALGMALAGQGRFIEAEPLLVSAHEKLVAHATDDAGNSPRRLRESSDAVLSLYTRWNRPEKVASWQAAHP